MTKHKTLKVGIVQQACTADVEANKQNLKRNIADVAAQGAELVVLQELHNSLYFCQVESTNNFDLAEPIPGPSTDFYGQIARQHGIVLVTSLFERRAAGLYHNTAVVFERDGSIAGKYRKMHIPDTGRHGFPPHRHISWPPWGAGLLGPMVPRGCAAHGPARCRTAHLPYSHRL